MAETDGVVRSRREDTPRRAAFWKVTGTLVAKVIGFLGDIVVASSIAAFISVTALYLIYRRMYAKVGWGLLIPVTLRIGAATVVMSAVIWLLREHVQALPLIILAAVVYMGLAFALQDSEARSYVRLALSLPARLRKAKPEE